MQKLFCFLLTGCVAALLAACAAQPARQQASASVAIAAPQAAVDGQTGGNG